MLIMSKLIHEPKDLHSNAPRRLVAAWRRVGCSDRKLATLLKVNHSYVSQLLWRGIEPGNPEIRVKLFLPRKKRVPREPKVEEFPGQKRIVKIIRSMHRETTRTFKRWKSGG